MDKTENIRREMVANINSEVQSNSEMDERARLEEEQGQVWNTEEVSKDFEITGFMAPFVVAIRKSDGKKGSLMFQHRPRFYFRWQEA